jgi:ketosteroid isomerase-like protein
LPEGDAQVIRAAYRALAARDGDALRDLLAADVEWHGPSPLMPAGGSYSSGEAVAAALTEVAGAAYDELRLEPEDLVEAGGMVFGRGSLSIRFRGGDETVTDTFLHVATVAQGRITASTLRCDSARVLETMPGTVVGTIG